MKRIFTLLLSLVLMLGIAACANQPEAEVEQVPETPAVVEVEEVPEIPDGVDWDFFNRRASAFIAAMAASDYDVAHAMFDETMAGLLNTDDLQAIWDEVVALAGAFVSIYEIENAEAEEISVFGASAYYIRDLERLTFEEHVRDVTIPILVMHAGRDFQTPDDPCFYLFQEIFAGRDNVTLNLYEDLNHAFMPSTATSFVEHATELLEGTGPMHAPALQDIVDWINGF